MSKTTAFLLLTGCLMLLLSACHHKRTEAVASFPLHDSIKEAIDKRQWDVCQRFIRECEKVDTNTAARLDLALLRSQVYFSFGRPRQMKAVLDSLAPSIEALKIGDRQANNFYLRYLHGNMGYYAQYTNEFDSMLFYGKRVEDFAMQYGEYADAILSMSNLADAYRQRGDINRSIMLYNQAIRLNDSLQVDSMLYLPMYSGMACAYNVLHNRQRTESWLHRMRGMAPRMTVLDSVTYQMCWGNCLYLAKDYEGSLRHFLAEDSILRYHPDMTIDRVICDVNLAELYLHLHRNSNSCDSLLENSRNYFEENGITAYLPYLHTLQIQHLLSQGNLDAALQKMTAVRAEVPKMNPDHRVARFKVMADVFEQCGQREEALRYYKAFSLLDDSLRDVQTLAMADEVESRYERDVLRQQQRAVVQEHELIHTRLYLIINVLIIILLLTGFAIYLYVRRSTQQYQLAIDKIVDLRSGMIRNRITPHFISNALALGRNLSQEEIDNIILLIRQGLTYDNSLTAPLQRELSLVRCYAQVAGNVQHGNLHVDIRDDSHLDLTKVFIPAMALLTIIENAIKHGRHDKHQQLDITIHISQQCHDVIIEVCNPGNLPDYCRPHDHAWHGLQMIQQTVALINRSHRYVMSFDIHGNDCHQVIATLVTRLS